MDTSSTPRRGPLHALQSFTAEAERYMEVTRRFAGLGHNDVHALSALVEAAEQKQVMTPGVLRRHLVLSPAATTALVDRLVAHGLIRREKTPTDGRTVELHATEKARMMGREMFEILSTAVMERLAHYPPSEVERMITMIRDLTDAARQARDELETGLDAVNGVAVEESIR